MVENDYLPIIKYISKEIHRCWNDDKACIELLHQYYSSIYSQVYTVLTPQKTDEAEKQIREVLAKYVVGYTDGKTKIVHIGALELIESKKAQIKDKLTKLTKSKRINEVENEILLYGELSCRCNELYDDFMALASYRSFKHFCLYIEEKYAPKDKIIWQYAEKHGLADGMWHCMTNMVTRGMYNKLFKQTPTGYFKTYSNICFIAWLFGIMPDTDVLYVLGNPSMPKKIIVGIKQQMTRAAYAKIFPYYAQFNCSEQKMFEINSEKDGELLISGANSLCNLKIFNKDTPIDGTRFKWRFYDDVTRSKDKYKANMHKKDNEMYHDDWTKRRYTEFDDYEIFSGTAYSPYDLINVQKENCGVDEAVKCQFKYCTINKQTKTMFVKIPKLDYETDESTLPEKYTTLTARRERERDAETFFAMEQQDPIPPTGLPFDWKKIRTYTELPPTVKNGGQRSDVCAAVLDPARTGSDNCSLGIHSKCGDLWYLTSCFYKKTPLDGKLADGRTALEYCCDLIIQKRVVKLIVETNTVSNIKKQIEDILFGKGYRSCEIIEIYSTQKKSDKIFDNQSTILEYIVFPDKKMYGTSSMMGQYMKNIVTWYDKTKENDDSIDTEAMFSENIILGSNSGNAKAKILYI